MKKSYIRPDTKVVTVRTCNIVCTSSLENGGNGDGIPAQAPFRDFSW